MAERKPGLFQRLLGPEAAAQRRPNCAPGWCTARIAVSTRSVWDTGGIRYKAAGTSRRYMRCPSCGQARLAQDLQGAGFPARRRPSPAFVVRLIRRPWSLLILLAAAGAILLSFKLSGMI